MLSGERTDSSFPSPVRKQVFPFLIFPFVFVIGFHPLHPHSRNTVSYPSSKTQRPQCGCFGWLVLNLSRLQMTSQHCIDSGTLCSASLPRPPTHTMWPYPWPWCYQNTWKQVTYGATFRLGLEATIFRNCYNLYKWLRLISFFVSKYWQLRGYMGDKR
jgi:hypothetical protein